MSNGLAEFEIIGNIGKIDHGEKVTRLSICANYRRKDEATGQYSDIPRWNSVKVFGEGWRKFIRDYVQVGDMVRVAGDMFDDEYEHGGETRYSTERHAWQFMPLNLKSGSRSNDQQP
jgi:single-strand DNA-binding protein